MKKGKGETSTTITGIVTPTDWDEKGNVVAVVVSSPSEEEYLIASDELGEELMELCGAQVMVTGVVANDKSGKKTIAVKKYELLEEEEEEEEEELDEEEFGDEEFDKEELDEEELEDEEFEEEEFDEKE
jgi:hypothetical protein